MGWNVDGEACHQSCRSGSIGFVSTLDAVTGNNIVEYGRVYACALNYGLHNMSRQLRCSHIFKSSSEFSYSRSNASYDYYVLVFAHIQFSSRFVN
jgi:hypothetical protein